MKLCLGKQPQGLWLIFVVSNKLIFLHGWSANWSFEVVPWLTTSRSWKWWILVVSNYNFCTSQCQFWGFEIMPWETTPRSWNWRSKFLITFMQFRIAISFGWWNIIIFGLSNESFFFSFLFDFSNVWISQYKLCNFEINISFWSKISSDNYLFDLCNILHQFFAQKKMS